MVRPITEGRKTRPTSVTIFSDQYDWAKQNDINLSELVREAIETKKAINEQTTNTEVTNAPDQ